MPAWRVSLDRWRALSRWERRTLCAACLLLPAISLSLKWRGLAATRHLLQRRSGKPVDRSGTGLANAIDNTARLVKAAADRHPFRTACLARSLTLWYLLSRAGIASDVRIGVTKTDGVLDAHAWVEADGRIVLDAPEVVDRYAPIM